jgi:plasmid stability protein
MRRTCLHVVRMGKMIQIRNVPDKIHRTLKARAAQAGMSLSEYLLREVKKVAERPTVEELIERIRKRGPLTQDVSGADLVREGREERDRELEARWSSLTPRR